MVKVFDQELERCIPGRERLENQSGKWAAKHKP